MHLALRYKIPLITPAFGNDSARYSVEHSRQVFSKGLLNGYYFHMVLMAGIEPATSSLPRKCSTPELLRLTKNLIYVLMPPPLDTLLSKKIETKFNT